MATITWTSAVAGNWNTGANWSGGVVPGAADDVVFDGTGVGNCALDVNATVLSVSANAGYTGAIDLGTNNLSVTGNFTLDHGGGVDFGSGTHVFSGFFDVKDCGTLDYATSSVELAGTGTNMLTWSATDGLKELYDVIVSGNLTTNDVPYSAIRATNSYTISGTLTHNATGGRETAIVAGTLIVSGTLAGSGDCLINTTASGAASLAISGSGSVTISKLKAALGGVTGSYVEIGAGDYSSCDVEMSTLNSGSDAPLRFSGDVTLKSLNFTASSGANIVVQNSTHNPNVTINGNVTCTTSNVVWSAGTGTITLAPTGGSNVNFNSQTVEGIHVDPTAVGPILLTGNATTSWFRDCAGLVDVNGFTLTYDNVDRCAVPYNPTAPPTLALKSGESINNGLVAWWTLTDGSGSTATDIVGTNDGTITNGTWSGQSVGSALYLDTSANTSGTGVNVSSGVAISFWYKDVGGTASGPMLFSLPRSTLGSNGVDIQHRGTGARFSLYTATSGLKSATAAFSINDGDWHHIAATYDGANIILYADGAQAATNTQTGTIGQLASGEFNINALASGVSGFSCDGVYQNVRVWSTALTAQQVSDIYTTPWLGSNYEEVVAGNTFFFPAHFGGRL